LDKEDVVRLLGCALFLLASVGLVWSQTDRGTITGTVSDPAGAVIGAATVEAKNADTGAVYQAGTSGTGNYTLAQMPAGTYELSISVPGFKKSVRPGIIVNVASTVRVDFALEVGAATESVTVQADAPLLKTESGELSHTVTSDQANNLPIMTLNGAGGGGPGNIRNPLAVVQLLPGAQFATDNTLRVNGMPSSTAAIRIEGQDATNGMWKQLTQVTQAGVDAIQEVAVQTSNFAAEYGQVGGGYFNFTMKSGTNQFHGSAYDYFNNEALNAGLPFTNDGHGNLIRNTLRRNDYGFTLGGPVMFPKFNGRDRTFFFFNFEQFREGQTVRNGLSTVPTDAMRAGDFSGGVFPFLSTPPDPLGRSFPAFTVMDPTTTFTGPGGVQLRNPYTNNQIPQNQWDPVAIKLQNLIPHANLPGNMSNYAIPAYQNNRHTTIPSLKIDHSLSPTLKLSGFMQVTRTTSPNANGFAVTTLPNAPTEDTTYITRINLDSTIRPTLLLHLGVGLQYFTHPVFTVESSQSQFWPANAQFAANNYMPAIGSALNFITGGMSLGGGLFGGSGPGVGGFNNVDLKDVKPTANVSLTWVKGNHTFKAGGELIVEGFPQHSNARANGGFNWTNLQTSNPWELGQSSFPFQTGFPYASFLIGAADSLNYSAITDSRLGNHSLGLFVQDTWKITRKLTLDYGVRWDYVTLLKEQYGRMQSAGFNTPNPIAGNRLGSVIYEATCNCSFNNNYPYALGPRLGVAYQIAPKTVLRAGGALAYGTSPNNAFLSYSVPDFYTLTSPGPGLAATQLALGNPYAPGNPYGNPVTVYPDFSPQYPSRNPVTGLANPQSPFISVDRNAGRPARILQWSIGLQREVARNLVVEAEYVGNRGVWWTAPVLATTNYNALTPEGLKANWGLDITSQADRDILTLPISSPAVQARFPQFRVVNGAVPGVYPGFPATQPLNQALRPFPQWNTGAPPFLGPPLGSTWYDSLQAKVTKRYSRGLSVDAAFTWQKELVNGANSDTSYFTPGPLIINDVFNRPSLKQISSLSRPFQLVVSFNYTTPKIGPNHVISTLTRDWVLAGVLRYQSGQVLAAPSSNNNLLNQLMRGNNPFQNPAIFGGGTTIENRNPGVPLMLVDPNCHCFNPQTTVFQNPAAWTDAPAGQFGTAAPYYNDYRWQRQPAESLSLGRTFRFLKERASVQVRAEFQNVFNRTFLSAPTRQNTATPPGATNGVYTSGYGTIATLGGAGTSPRQGQLVARFQF
jgi:hypothetical protein